MLDKYKIFTKIILFFSLQYDILYFYLDYSRVINTFVVVNIKEN